jgi:ribosomal protein S18 acetylase RimI-like enzyme
MIIREVEKQDLDGLQELYLHLHEREKLRETPELSSLWEEIIADENYHILIGEVEGKIVSSVTVIVIKNLTRGMRPYALIENVVTHKDYRCRGYARTLMQKAVEIAESKGCYKIMLLIGSKNESTLRFYEKCGFNSKDKTAFIRWAEGQHFAQAHP